MKLFKCQNCGQVLYFENRRCESCFSQLGYLPLESTLAALQPADSQGLWQVPCSPSRQFRFCANARFDACNWLVPADGGAEFCISCRHNRTIPDLSVSGNLASWRQYELAKHRLFYTLIGLGVPLTSRAEDPLDGLAFDFLAETSDHPNVITGHVHGLITLNLKEADDVERARQRLSLGEPYRTLLGHLRHESGHYFWSRLVMGESLNRFRQIFGDERQDYCEALRIHYARGPLPEWGSDYITAYAACHPLEDFAETWAHYLHIVDTMEMAFSFGSRVGSGLVHPAPQGRAGFREFVGEWRALTVFMNSLNRCMGGADLYPFILSPPVIDKLEFVHLLVARSQALNMGEEMLAAGATR
jgi:hypothetical protein